jgi:tRNA(Ile)-lysidine synthase
MKYIYPPFFRHISDKQLIRAGDTIIAAFSGGKDSLSLLHLMKRLEQDIPVQLIAAYFNHRIRTDHSEEQRFVEKTCRDMDIQLVVQSEDVESYRKKNRLNLEHAASLLRYRFLEEAGRKYRPAKIATGHTRSDLAETFLIKLLRGSGSRGLSSIYARKGTRIIRPLLIFSKEETEDFLQRNHIGFYSDTTNLDNTLLRNRIRHILLPEIKKIEPGIERHLFNTAAIIQDEYDYFISRSREFLTQNLILDHVLPMDPLKSQHPALQRFILREYIRRLKGDLLDINFSHIENILHHQSRARCGSLPGLSLKYRKGFLYPANFRIPAYHYTADSLGTIVLNETGKKISIKKTGAFRTPRNNFEMITPLKTLRFPLRIRNANRNDAYTKINSGINQSVFEMIRSTGIPSDLRNLCPLILDAVKNPVWVAGSPLAEPFKVKEKKQGPFIRISYV